MNHYQRAARGLKSRRSFFAALFAFAVAPRLKPDESGWHGVVPAAGPGKGYRVTLHGRERVLTETQSCKRAQAAQERAIVRLNEAQRIEPGSGLPDIRFVITSDERGYIKSIREVA